MWLKIELSLCSVPSVQEPIVLTAFFSLHTTGENTSQIFGVMGMNN